MSVEAMTWAFEQKIPPAQKVVLLALANNADKKSGFAWPGLESIVENCAPMGKRMVQRHIRWLAQHNLLSVEARFTEKGRQTSNLYRLHLDTTCRGMGVIHDTLNKPVENPPKSVTEGSGRVSEVTPLRMSQLCHGEDVAALTPSDKNLDPLFDPSEGTPGAAHGLRRHLGDNSATSETWEAYRLGNVELYGIEPVRDATTNTVLKRLVQKFGRTEAPLIVRQYFRMDRKLYVENKHPPTLLLRDCYGIRTEMKTEPKLKPKPVLGPKAYQPAPSVSVQGEPCPPDAAEKLAKIRGKKFLGLTPAEELPASKSIASGTA